MTDSFVDDAVQAARIAAQLLGWRPDEFWRATPSELTMALFAPATNPPDPALSREHIAQMMERDKHG